MRLGDSAGFEEFRDGWGIVFSAFVGVAVGLVALPFYTYGVFAPALQEEFGWSRGATQLPLLFQTVGLLLMLPVVGSTVDRYGPRLVALISMGGYALVWLLFARMGGTQAEYFLIAFLLGVIGSGTLPVTWTRGVNGAFEIRRGLALGLALMGSGATGFFAPRYVTCLVELHGWREAYVGMALLPAIVGLPVVWLFFRRRRDREKPRTAAPPVRGASLAEALRDRRFWLVAFAFLFVSFAIGGTIPSLFQLFLGKGFDAPDAAAILSILGVAVVLGRLGTGYLLDRFPAPRVSATLVGIPSVACAILVQPEISTQGAYAATALVGFAAGAEFDIIAYLAAKYFGLRHYSKIYSVLYAAFALGAAAAPAAFGYVFDWQGSYDSMIYASAILFAVGSALLLRLGRSSAGDRI